MKESSRTHWRYGSPVTASASRTPSAAAAVARSASPVAGTIRSTTVAGKATAPAIRSRISARSGQFDARTKSWTTRASTAPLPAMLSQDTTVSGGAPARIRAASEAASRPTTVVSGPSGLGREVGGHGPGHEVEPAGRRRPVIALLRHGQRHHRDLGVGEQCVDGLGVRPHGQRADDRAHDACAVAVRTAFGERVQTVLVPQGAYGPGRTGRDRGDAPGLTGTGGGLLGVHRLMGPVEGAEAEVDDTGA